MATKKKKPAAAEFNTLDVSAETSTGGPDAEMTESDKILAKAGTVDPGLSDEIRQKIDSADKLAEENARYSEEIADLQERIVGYIKEIAELKSQHTADSSAEIVRLRQEIEDLKSENAKLKAGLRAPQGQPPAVGRVYPQTLTPNCYRRRIIGEYPSWN